MLKTDFFERISSNNKLFIRVLPGVNEFGLALRIRYQNSFRHPDINRNFVGEGLDHISKEIIKLTKDMDLIVDFHEGWGFHLLQPKSLGSTLTLTEGARPLGQLIINNLNKTIANENIKQIKEWRDLNPDCTDVDSKKNNLYLKIVSNSMNGSTQEESHKNINKIISNVAKEVVINK
jgi:hypothetical protein